jgi:hypothetical protein
MTSSSPATPPGAPTRWGPLGGLAWGVLAVAAGLRFWGLDLGLPHLEARPDETETLRLTLEAAAGRFDFDWAIYPHAYATLQWAWAEAVLALGALVQGEPAPAMSEVWQREPARLYAIGRGLSAVAGTGTVALLLGLVRRELGGRVALVAGLWLAVNVLHVRESHSLKPDALLTLGLTACLAATAAMARRPGARSAVVAGVAVGAAGAMKYNGVLGALPVAVGAWWAAAGQRGLRRLLPAPLLLAGVCAVAAFWLFNPFLPFNEEAHDVVLSNLHAVFPEWIDHPAGRAGGAPVPIEGPGAPAWIAAYGAWGALAYHCAFSLWYGVGGIAALATPIAIVWGFCSRQVLLVACAALVVVWFIVTSTSPVALSRYITPALPALAILQAAGLYAGVQRLGPRRAGLVLACAAILLLAQPLVASVRFDALAARTDTRVLAMDWLAANAVGARVAVVGTRFWHYGEPRLPAGVRRVPLRSGAPVERSGVDFVVTHDHELFWSSVPSGFATGRASRLELLVDFDPRVGGEGVAVFEANDAFYLPIAGFGGVTLPGPRVQIYRVR